MIGDLKILEEYKIRDFIENPDFTYVEGTILERRRVSVSILMRREVEVLLIHKSCFLIDSVFAGLSENHIEYIAKNGPKNYKENLLKILDDQGMMKGVFEIAEAMDEDLGDNITKNQERVKNVIQYIKDNRVAFEV